MINQFASKDTVSGTDANDTGLLPNSFSERGRLKKLLIVPRTAVATHASNYMTFLVKKGATTIATFTTNSSGGSALTADTPVAMTIAGTGTDLELAENGVLTITATKSGTGPAYDLDIEALFEGIRS